MSQLPDELAIDLADHGAAASLAGRPQIFLAQEALDEMNRHAAEEDHHEIGGILVGFVAGDSSPLVVVEAVIRGTQMSHARGSVTFTHDSWTEINRAMDEQYGDKKIVGWYHSHPGFGIFLSDYDTFIHGNFFTAPWQVAFVTDPKAHTCGFFSWQDGKLGQAEDYWVFGPCHGQPRPALEVAPPGPLPVTATMPVPVASAPQPPGILWALGLLAVILALTAAISVSSYYSVSQTLSAVRGLEAKVSALAADAATLRQEAKPPVPTMATEVPPPRTGPPAESSPETATKQPAALPSTEASGRERPPGPGT